MPTSSFWFRLGLGVCLMTISLSACKDKAAAGHSSKSGKWIPYNEKSVFADQALRRKLRIERREAKSNSPGDTGEVWFDSEVILYNEYGQEVLKQEKSLEGKIVKETRNDYRDTLLIRQSVKEATGYSSAIEYTYNEKAQKIGELLFQRGDSVMRRRYTLDQRGNEIRVDLVRMRDSTEFQLITGRDSLGRPATVKETQDSATNWSEVYVMSDTVWRIKRSNGAGKVQSDYEMRFDKNGAMQRMTHLDPEGKMRLQVQYVNDDNGRPLKETFFGGNGQMFQTYEYDYDADGLLIERRLATPSSQFVMVTKYTYVRRSR